ncbi:helix-turn-helix domain-containing protein [Vibrio lentus]|uniref:helix-turn-helix domain-containing protein n=1 Tax=Vibrio lentus TaxID=136468 RepID=UPI000C834F29|nr:helix-turn-helix transcriptional regulator [Vibrio lentus]PMM24930.1 transcriptional regulator [Vibrio lentus]
MISVQIKDLRDSRNLSQDEVAKALGMAKSTYIKYEKGTQSPQLETIEEIANFYGVTVEELITTESPTINSRLLSKLNLIEKLNEEEKESIILMIEGLIFRRQNLDLSNLR